MFNADDYRNTLPYPDKPRRPSLGPRPTKDEVEAYLVALSAYETNMPVYTTELAAYHAEEQRLLQKFWDDTAAEYGYTNNPKRSKLEHAAWQLGHSAGYSEVYNYVGDLVELIE